MEKRAVSEHPIHELLARRWSPLAMAPRAIPRETLASLLEAARWAPSSRNEQPWSFIVGLRDQPEHFERLLSCLAAANATWAKNAGALILSVAKLKFDHNGVKNPHAWYDVGQATAMLVLQAVDVGLVAHQMAGFDPEKARELCGIPSDFEPVAVTAIGFAGDPSELPENLRSRELAPRLRRPLPALAFAGTFGHPLFEA